MTVHLYVGSPFSDCPPFDCGRTAPEVSEEEGSYASRFYRWYLESSKSCLSLTVALSGLIDTLAQLVAWRSLLWLSMTWRWRYLTQSNFLSATSLAWSLALHLLFCFIQEKPLRWKEIKRHTQGKKSPIGGVRGRVRVSLESGGRFLVGFFPRTKRLNVLSRAVVWKFSWYMF